MNTSSSFTKTAWTAFTTSWPFDSEGFIVIGGSPSAGVNAISLDIARGAAGSEIAVVSDFRVPETTSCLCEYMPIRMRAGERVSGRIAADSSFVGLTVALYPIAPTTRRVYGVGGGGNRWQTNLNAGTLRGTQIDPGGAANAKGAWTTLISSTNAFSTALMIGTRGWSTINAQTNCLIDIGIGSSGQEVPLIPNVYQFNQPNSSNWDKPYMLFPVSLPQGTRISARAQADSTDASDRLCEVFLNVIG